MLPAAILCKGWKRGLALGALFVYAAAEFVQFQPNPYDNNKLFYVAFMLMLPLVGSYLVALWDRLRGLPGRALLAAVFLFLSLTSGVLSLGREAVSDYHALLGGRSGGGAVHPRRTARGRRLPDRRPAQQPGGGAGGAADRLRHEELPLLPRRELPAQAALDARRMLEAPEDSHALFEEYGVDYVVIGSSERYNYALDEAYFAANCALVYDEGGVSIYAAPENDRNLPEWTGNVPGLRLTIAHESAYNKYR